MWLSKEMYKINSLAEKVMPLPIDEVSNKRKKLTDTYTLISKNNTQKNGR